MSLLVVGSIAFDSVETPFGKAEEVLGGSATYFSTTASYFTNVRLVAVVGSDFPDRYINFLKKKNIDIQGLQKARGKTFRWKGRYDFDLNQAHTLDTRLNVFASFKPRLPEEYKNTEYVFLANIDPVLQLEVLKQIKEPKLVACDTMNFWIERKPKELKETIKHVDILTINEAEARQLSGESNLVKAAKRIMSYGPEVVIIKRGEYGALMFSDSSVFAAPAYPLESVFDPTGAGDSFAGGFMGYLASIDNINDTNIRRAIIMGSVMASFNVEDFSLNRIKNLSNQEIENRYKAFKRLTHFKGL
ncbi:MAG: PfkB family carbohydrate kinase [bacterium]